MFIELLSLCCVLFHPVVSAATLESDIEDDSSDTNSHPICVVGAGISGLGVSTFLQRKGYKVQVFEESVKVGGKMNTYRESDEIQAELGPVIYGSESKFLLGHINAFNLTTLPFNYSDIVGFDPNTGIFKEYPTPTTPEALKLGDAMIRYISERAKADHQLQLETGYLDASSELFEPTAVWLKKRDLEILTPVFNLFVTILGYGDLNDVPAMYSLQMVDPHFIIKVSFGQSDALSYLKEGYDVLASKIAESIDVHLNHRVTHISRELEHPVIFLETTKDNETVRDSMNCSKVILAFPPLFSNLDKMMDLSLEEEDVFRQVKIHKYTSAVNYIPNLEHSGYYEGFKVGLNNTLQEISPVGSGETVSFIWQSSLKKKGVYTSYHWIRGSFDEMPTKSDMDSINRQLEATLKTISKDAYTLQRSQTQYFPHVNTESLRNGFYKKFDKINGHRGCYYATTLLSFESMEFALKMTHDLVQRYF